MSRHTPLILLTALAVTASFWAFTQADGEVIQACASKNGLLRLIGAGFKSDACKSNETPVSWSEQGIQGEKGDTGEQGEQGEKGEAGESGADGTDGNDGVDGTTLHLFDDDGQDLGIFLNFDDSSGRRRTYIPEIDALVDFHVSSSNQRVRIERNQTIRFTQEDCKDDPYTNNAFTPEVLLQAQETGRFFVVMPDAPTAPTLTKSELTNSGCTNLNSGPHELFLLREVTLPFSYPPAYPPDVRAL